MAKEIDQQKTRSTNPVDKMTQDSFNFKAFTEYLEWFQTNHVALASKFDEIKRKQAQVDVAMTDE